MNLSQTATYPLRTDSLFQKISSRHAHGHASPLNVTEWGSLSQRLCVKKYGNCLCFRLNYLKVFIQVIFMPADIHLRLMTSVGEAY